LILGIITYLYALLLFVLFIEYNKTKKRGKVAYSKIVKMPVKNWQNNFSIIKTLML